MGPASTINLNSTNPNTGTSDPGSGILTIGSTATFTDATTGAGLSISALNRGGGDTGATAAVNNQGTFTKSGGAATSTISTLFNNTGIVNVTAGTLNLSGGGTDVGATYQSTGTGTIEFGGGTRTLSGSNVIANPTLINNGIIALNGGTLAITSTVTGTGSAIIAGEGTLEIGAADAQTVTYSGMGSTLKLDNPTPTSFTGHINGLVLGDIIDLTNTTVTGAAISGSTLTVTESNSQTLTYQIAGALSGNSFAIQSDNAGGDELVLTDASSYFWGNFYSPSQQGVHLFSGKIEADPFTGAVAFLDSSTGPAPSYDPVNDPTGPYSITRSILPLDPFFLPTLAGSQVVMPAILLTLPARTNFILPSINTANGVQSEGIGIFETQDGTGNNVLDQVIATGSSGGDYSPLSISSPTQIENAGTNTIYNLDVSFRQDNGTAPASYLSTYSVAWDQYNPSTQTFSLGFRIFNPDGSLSSGTNAINPAITPTSSTTITASATPSLNEATTLPAWSFRNGGGIYALAIGEHNSSTNKDFIQFQGYNTDGTANTSNSAHLENFQIQSVLTAYAAGATNHITQDVIPTLGPFSGSPSQQMYFAQTSANNASDWLVGWNETVTDSSGVNFLGDQVEFVVDKPGTGIVSRYTAQLSDAQNVRVATYTDTSGNDFAVFIYGDGTTTHLVDFEINGGGATVTQIASITDPTTQPFSNVASLGDGRIEVNYDNVLDSSQTSQYDMKIFDFRTVGLTINDSSLADGQDKYIAGTHYSDTFTGENNVNNLYYYVGLNGTASLPSDTFHGGNSGWNVAVFPDSRANYTVQQQAGGFLIQNVGDSAHAGSLTVDSNVQALAFGPTHDPLPHNDGSLEATGDTLVILQSLSNAASIDAGATLEIAVASSAEPVTFNATTGILRLDQSVSYNGTISGFSTQDGTLAGSDQIDLRDISSATAHITGYTGGVLTVTDGTNTANLHFSGAYVQSDFNLTTDGPAGGTIIYDPPSNTSDTVAIGATVELNANSNTSTVDFQGTTGKLIVDQPSSFTGQIQGFTGDGTLSGSDQIDLSGINHDSSGFTDSYSDGTLTVSDGTNTANIHFTGTYNESNFSFAGDGHGGTIVYDPPTGGVAQTTTEPVTVDNDASQGESSVISPAANSPNGTTVTATSADQTLTGMGNNDTFVFTHGFGDAAITNFQPTNDVIQIDHSVFADVQTLLAAMQDDGHGNVVITADAHNSITLQHVTVAQLQVHQADFHII